MRDFLNYSYNFSFKWINYLNSYDNLNSFIVFLPYMS